MKRIAGILLLICCSLFCLHLFAQQKGRGKPEGDNAHSKKVFMPPVYLGHSDKSGGPIKKEDFGSLLRQGLTSRDSIGNKYKVLGFDFIYGERILYEDSTGTLQVLVDYNTAHCYGDTITHDMATTVHAEDSKTGEESPGIYDRVKNGDTIYFEHIRVERMFKNTLLSISDTTPIAGRYMKFWIVR